MAVNGFPNPIPDPRMIHARLLAHFGRRGWWPLEHRAGQAGFDVEGYHPDGTPGDFGTLDIWCVFAGAVLAQRSTWVNARRGLKALLDLLGPRMDGALPPGGLLSTLDVRDLEEAIRPSGFFRQKARRLADLELRLLGVGFFDPGCKCPSRNYLLSLSGLGPETADVLWTYARLETGFVSDAYTSRIFTRLSASKPGTWNYRACQSAVLGAWEVAPDADQPGMTIPQALGIASKDTTGNDLRELHALLVELGKACCRTKPVCGECPLNDCCGTARVS